MNTKLNETPAYELAGLMMDLMSNIRKGVISILELKKFLMMKSSDRRNIFGIPIEHPKMKLTSSGIEVPKLTEEFNPKTYFTKNKSVRYWLGDNFQKYVLSSIKTVPNLPAMFFNKHQFSETITDKEIMEHFQISESRGLMTGEEISRTIAYLTSKQPNGEQGILQNNGYLTIIGYMLCDDCVVRVVRVHWRSDDRRWGCNCGVLVNWRAGSGLLSRNEF